MIFKNENIVFIYGSPRSGTTRLWGIISSSPEILPYTKYKGTSESGEFVTGNGDKLAEFASKTNLNVLEKTPKHTLMHATITHKFPNAKRIIIFRHPLGIYNSIITSNMKAFQGMMKKHIFELIKKYYEALCDANGHVLTYEDLYDKQEKEIKRLENYLNIYIPKNIDASQDFVKTAGANNKRNPYSYKSMGKVEMKRAKAELKYEIEIYSRIQKYIKNETPNH